MQLSNSIITTLVWIFITIAPVDAKSSHLPTDFDKLSLMSPQGELHANKPSSPAVRDPLQPGLIPRSPPPSPPLPPSQPLFPRTQGGKAPNCILPPFLFSPPPNPKNPKNNPLQPRYQDKSASLRADLKAALAAEAAPRRKTQPDPYHQAIINSRFCRTLRICIPDRVRKACSWGYWKHIDALTQSVMASFWHHPLWKEQSDTVKIAWDVGCTAYISWRVLRHLVLLCGEVEGEGKGGKKEVKGKGGKGKGEHLHMERRGEGGGGILGSVKTRKMGGRDSSIAGGEGEIVVPRFDGLESIRRQFAK